MDFGFEGFIISFFFLLPGFVATYIRLSIRPHVHRSKSVFQETLGSLSASVPIFLCQILVLMVLFLTINVFHVELSLVFKSGAENYFSLHPIRSTFFLLVWSVLAFILSIVFGYVDPIEKIVDWNQKRTGNSQDDFWYSTFKSLPKGENLTDCFVMVWLKSGMCYSGIVKSYEPTSEKADDRYLLLFHGERWKSYNDALKNRHGEGVGAILLKASEINSIDIWFVGGMQEEDA